jgi:S1-C subfamily serine protease
MKDACAPVDVPGKASQAGGKIMARIHRVFVVAALVALTGASVRAADEQFTPTQLARLGKAATALVEVKAGPGQFRQGYGSAFCIHASGLFVTNEHVVNPSGPGIGSQPGTGAQINLVLNPGEKTEKSYTARVVRTDKQLDLALLRIDNAKDFRALHLGDDEELEELMDVVAFGFPFGAAMGGVGAPPIGQPPSANRHDYPSVSVNAGRITALRRKGGDLDRIQLDATINPGNSGGPVLDKNGKVIGLVVSIAVAQGLGRTGISHSIPVSHLKRFLARPDLAFTVPAVNRSNQDQPAEFRAKATSLLPTTAPLELELVLERAGEPERRYPMELAEGVYRAKAIPFPGRKGPLVFRLEVKYEDGSVTGVVEDLDFKLDQQQIKLSQAEHIRLGPKAKVKLGTGGAFEGKLSGLESILVKVGKQPLRLDLASAIEVKIDSPTAEAPVSCIIVARQSGKEVGRLEEPIYLEGSLQVSMDALRDGKFIKPPRSTSPVSYLRAISSKGDYIGQGKTYSYPGESLTIRRNDRGVNIMVGGPVGWHINFGAPQGQFLEVGEYLDATRYPFSGASPGIEFTGQGRGCNQISGQFVVWELEFKGNEVSKLAVDFVQRCETRMPPLYGRLRYRSSFH